jgi:pimeloyl-ACP methyl ester carboxylesterase
MRILRVAHDHPGIGAAAYAARMTRHDLALSDGRRLVVHATDGPSAPRLTLLWHHGSPHTGALLQPVVDLAAEREIRVVSYARPSYGGSTPRPGRTVGDAASDVAAILDALGLAHVVTMGASGGGPHALACAALLPERVTAAVTLAGVATYSTEFDWFGGMTAPGGLRSALDGGRVARAAFAETDTFDPRQFVEADWTALGNRWAALGQDAQAAEANGPDGLIDDDVAFTSPWGFDLGSIAQPVLVVQGEQDRVIPPAHGWWLVANLPDAKLWLRPGDGHVSVLDAVPDALDWLLDRPARPTRR